MSTCISLLVRLMLAAAPLAGAAELLPLFSHGTGVIADIDQSGALVAVANGDGVDLFDSTPAGFVPLSHLNFDSGVGQVVISGDFLYVGVSDKGLHAVDITNPAVPVMGGYVTTTGGWRELEVTGDVIVAFTSGWGWNIFVGDLTDPLHPAAADSISLDNYQNGFDLGDGHFYYVSQTDDLQTWSVVDPYNAHRTHQYQLGDPRWTGVVVSGELLWTMGDDTAVFSLANPAVPTLMSRAPIAGLFSRGTAFGPFLYRNLGSASFDLIVYDYTVPTAPVAVDTLFGVSGHRHAGAGELLVGTGTHLRSFDLSDPAAPVENAGHFMERVQDLAGEAGRIWAASYEAGLSCLDATDVLNPVWRGPWLQAGSVTRVAADGDRMALVDTSGVRLFDVAASTSPVEILAIAANAVDVDIEGSVLAYTADDALHVVDLANGYSTATVPLGGLIFRVEMENGHAFVGNAVDMVTNVDIADPAAPVVIGPLALPGWTSPFLEYLALAADSNLLVAGTFGSPSCVFDISMPAAPVYRSHAWVDLPFPADLTRSLALNGRWLLVGMGGTVHVIDLIDPLNPVDVTGPLYASAEATTWADRQHPATGGYGGVTLFGMDMSGLTAVLPPAARSLGLTLAPNPANPRMVISWNLRRAGHLQADVFDLAGRRVVRLVDGHRGSGQGSVAWDGRDASGRAMSSGVYLVRLESAGLSESRSVTLVR